MSFLLFRPQQFKEEWAKMGGLLRVADAAKLTGLTYWQTKKSPHLRRVRIGETEFVSAQDVFSLTTA